MTVYLPGRPGAIRWPALCANCGAPAAATLPVAKAFARRIFATTRRARDPWKFAVPTFHVPFCAACAARHHAEVMPLSSAQIVFSYLRSEYAVAIVGCVIGLGLFVQPLTVPAGETALTIAPNAKQALGLLFGLLFCCPILWYATRRFRMPPQSDVTRAFDFDDWNIFSGPTRRYRIRNAAFADAIRTLNA